MKAPSGLLIAFLCMGFAGASTAASEDPMLGVWRADLAAMSPQDPSLSRQMLRVTAITGGYVFHFDLMSDRGNADIIRPIILDNRSHVAQTDSGPASSTCHSAELNTIDCQMRIAGSSSQISFALSTDGSTLTETDVVDVEQPRYPSQASPGIDDTRAYQEPRRSDPPQNTTAGTRVVIYHRQ